MLAAGPAHGRASGPARGRPDPASLRRSASTRSWRTTSATACGPSHQRVTGRSRRRRSPRLSPSVEDARQGAPGEPARDSPFASRTFRSWLPGARDGRVFCTTIFQVTSTPPRSARPSATVDEMSSVSPATTEVELRRRLAQPVELRERIVQVETRGSRIAASSSVGTEAGQSQAVPRRPRTTAAAPRASTPPAPRPPASSATRSARRCAQVLGITNDVRSRRAERAKSSIDSAEALRRRVSADVGRAQRVVQDRELAEGHTGGKRRHAAASRRQVDGDLTDRRPAGRTASARSPLRTIISRRRSGVCFARRAGTTTGVRVEARQNSCSASEIVAVSCAEAPLPRDAVLGLLGRGRARRTSAASGALLVVTDAPAGGAGSATGRGRYEQQRRPLSPSDATIEQHARPPLVDPR